MLKDFKFFEKAYKPMRWVNVNGFNFHYRVYTHIDMLEVQRIVSETIIPFLYETNNYENQQMILRSLGSRFHSAQIVEDEGL